MITQKDAGLIARNGRINGFSAYDHRDGEEVFESDIADDHRYEARQRRKIKKNKEKKAA